MAELESEDEHAEDYDYESSACLDEYGWDPSVDAFLEEVVEEAPLLPNGHVDFSWVCSMFLETLSPDEDQVEAALERFSPSALQERHEYLRSRHVAISSNTSERREAEQIVAERSRTPPPSTSSSVGGYTSSVAVAEEPALQLESSGTSRPGRDRVLHSMHNFLYGRPRPEAQEMSPKPQQTPGTSSAATEVVQAVSTPAVCSKDVSETAKIQQAKVADTCAPASSEDLSVSACTNEALRCCLEELRWHGEALRRCADGAEASVLAIEAAERRKALLWRLGLGPKEVAAGRGAID
jgi:hypothetical protein